MKPTLIALLLLLSQLCTAQNYITYQRTFNRIDEDVLSSNLPAAIQRLDSIGNRYRFIYAKHCLKAIQICAKANDSIRAEGWLKKAFLQGVPMWMLNRHELTRKVLTYTNTQAIVKAYDSLNHVYRSSVDQNMAARIERMLEKDQFRTRRVNDGFFLFRHTIYGLQWLKGNSRHFDSINHITDTYGFPGERVVGLSPCYADSNCIQNFYYWRRVVADERAYIILVHYYSYGDRDMKQKLLAAVQAGNMPPEQMGTLLDYQQRYGKDKGTHAYYYTWKEASTEPIDLVNQRRDSIGLNTLEQQQRNTLLERERRKNRTTNKEIILE